MGCKYEYYKSEEKYYPFLYCQCDNKKCLYQKKCLKVERYISIEGDLWKECPKMIEQEQKNIPKNSYFVQSYRKNAVGKLYLYVVINDRLEKILTDLTEINQNYVYLQEKIDGYEISLVPFKTATTTGTKKK